MKVLVTGGDGFIGRHLCTTLAERGHTVTALSRRPDDSVLPDGVETVAGDVTDREGVDAVVEGQDAIVNLVSLTPLYEPQGRSHEAVHLGGTEVLVEAAEGAGVQRFVQMSGLGVDPDADTAYLRAKGRAEEVVRASALDWVIVRPSVVFGDGAEFLTFTKRLKRMFAPVVPLYPLPGGGTRTRFQPMYIGDLAPMLAACVEDDGRARETYELGGPDILTLREVTEMVYEAEGKRLVFVPLPMPVARLGLTVLGVVPGFPMGPDQYRSLKLDNTVENNDISAFGVEETDLRSFVDYLESG